MVLKKERYLKTVIDGLSLLRSSCESRGKSGLFDLNTLAEDFFCPFLNSLYGLNLQILGKEQAAIDLGDLASGVAFQITSDATKAKIQSTLDKFATHKLYQQYPHLRVVIIGKRRKAYVLRMPRNVRFSPDADILDVPALGEAARKLSTPRVEDLAQIIEQEIDKPSRSASKKGACSIPIEVTINGNRIELPGAHFSFAPDAGWWVELMLRNKSDEILEPDDYSIALVLPSQLYIKDEYGSDVPKYSYPVRLDRSNILYEMTHFDKLLPGVIKNYGIALKTSEDRPLRVGDSAKAIVRVNTRCGNKEYPITIVAVDGEDNQAAVQKKKKQHSNAPNKHAVLKLASFIRGLESESKSNLPSISWVRTFGPIDPKCKGLTKKEIIPRIFGTTNHEKLVTYLGAVKGMYGTSMKRKDVRDRFARVCAEFGVEVSELV